MLGATMVVPTVPVSDLERAKAFYGPTLRLTVLWENPASVRFRCGEVSHRPRHPGRFQRLEPVVAELDARLTLRDASPAAALLFAVLRLLGKQH